jgi:hypothetical protein
MYGVLLVHDIALTSPINVSRRFGRYSELGSHSCIRTYH